MDDTAIALASGAPKVVEVRRGSALEIVRRLEPGGRVLGLTMGQFSLIDLLSACLERTGPADVWLSAWTMGIRDAKSAGLLLDRGAIKSLALVLDRSFATRQPAYCAAVVRMFGKEAIRCARIHAKVFVVRGGGLNITCRSSMNLNRNKRIEQYDIDDNEHVADYFCAFFDEIEAASPPGPRVRAADVDAVFDRIRRGLNPFAEKLEIPASVPMENGGELRAWYAERVVELRRAGVRVPFAREARAVGATVREARKALADPQSHNALARDLVCSLLARRANAL